MKTEKKKQRENRLTEGKRIDLFLSVCVLCAMVFLFFYYNYTRVVLFSQVASSIYCVFIVPGTMVPVVVSKSIVTSSSLSKR